MEGLSNLTDILPTVLELAYDVRGGEYPAIRSCTRYPKTARSFSAAVSRISACEHRGLREYIHITATSPMNSSTSPRPPRT